jgi:hypothetical protein
MNPHSRFVLILGLPGSGKTTLARRLAPALHLLLIDKDDILERLFESKGVGDTAWPRTLSRESDVILEREATASNGAIVVSFWRLPGMPLDSGTPLDWEPPSWTFGCRNILRRGLSQPPSAPGSWTSRHWA